MNNDGSRGFSLRMISVIMLMLLFVAFVTSVSRACNQNVLDDIYAEIVKICLRSKGTTKDFEERNNAIETIHKLCDGQKSCFEIECPQNGVKHGH